MKYLTELTTFFILMLLASVSVFAGTDATKTTTEDDVRVIEIEGSDQMKFNVNEIIAEPGEQIQIVLTTISKLPKAAMAHNVVILGKGVDSMAFATASAQARDNQYIAPEFEDRIVAATDLAGGGETVKVTFTVPEEEGNYDFLCSFPGHYMAGMKGVLQVTRSAS